MIRKTSFGEAILRIGNNHERIATAYNVFQKPRGSEVPPQLQRPIRDPDLEGWFRKEAKRRFSLLPKGCLSFEERAFHLESPNRYPSGSMQPISLNELMKMSDFYGSPKDILDRAKQGVELLSKNKKNDVLGTAARGIPAGGASTRAQKWVEKNPTLSRFFGLDPNTPRTLYRVGGRTLIQLTIDFSQHIARQIGKVFPNIIMTNSEIVEALMKVVREEWGNFRRAELENTIFFNQIVLPRLWVEDQEEVKGKLFPAGHGDFPYLLSCYQMAKTLRSLGVRFLIFSNADEWLWQADPVMISIAHELFEKGHHMVAIGVENTNNQFGGGFVIKSDGSQTIVETPRLPWEIVKEGKAPIVINTTFYVIDLEYLADNEEKLREVEKSLIVKEIPGRKPGTTEQIFGVDSWAGDVFGDVLNPAFIFWPRMNFLGIKDGGHITDRKILTERGGRSSFSYVRETIDVWPVLITDLTEGKMWAAEHLFDSGYSYLPLQKGFYQS